MDQLPSPVYFGIIFYYTANENEKGTNYSERSKELEKSLSEILTLFYPLAGRYIEETRSIDCNDQGIEYLEAQVRGQLSQVLNGKLQAEQLNHFIPFPTASLTSPLIATQISIFECGGVAIGMRISHRIADGFTAISFINEWAKTCHVGIDKAHCPGFCLASLFPARETPGIMNRTLKKDGKKIVTKKLLFTKTTLSSLKEIAKTGATNMGGLEGQPSRVHVVTALIWRTLIKVAKAKLGYLRPSLLAHVVDMRGKTTLPIPTSCCGNLIRPATARFVPNDRKMGLHNLVGLVKDAIKNALVDCTEAINYDDLLLRASSAFRELDEEFNKNDTDVYMFSSWCRFPIYDVDFGWGKPAWVSSVHKPVQAISLMDATDDGIEAWLSLEEDNMILFQQDPEIIAFTTFEEDQHP